MGDFFNGLISGSAGDTSRYNLWGLLFLAAGVLLNVFAGALARKTRVDAEPLIKIAGLVLGVIGALIAMKLIG